MSILDQPSGGGNGTGSILDGPAPTHGQGPTLKGLEHGAGAALGHFGHWLARGTASNASGLSQTLDYQRRRSQEGFFHQGSSDANRAALRKKIGITNDYAHNSPFERGLVDFSLDTLTDPLTYETFGLGAVAKGAGKGLEWLGRAAEHLAPEGAKTARSAANIARENLSLGGREVEQLRRAHGKGAKDTVLGAMTHSDAEGAQVATLLQKRMSATMQHLKPAERAEVLQVLNGERPMPASGPIHEAAQAMRRITDDQLYLQLNERNRQLFPLARRATVNRQIGGRIQAPTGTPVVRWERPGSTGTGSRLRGGRSFMVGVGDTTYRGGENSAREGGEKAVSGYVRPQNPLHVAGRMGAGQYGSAGGEAIQHLGDEKLKALAKIVERGENPGAEKLLLEHIGITGPEAADIMNRTGHFGVLDRVGSELARRAGHDAITVAPHGGAGSPELVMLNHAAQPAKYVRPPSALEGFEAMDPARVGRGTKAKVGNLPQREYTLPENLREFATVPGEATLKNFRRNYVAGLAPEAAEGEARAAGTFNPLAYQNPNLLGRQEFKIDAEHPEKYLEALTRSSKNAGKAVSTSRLHDRLAKEFGGSIPSSVLDAIEQKFHATGDARTDKERVLDAIRGVTGYGKAALTQLSPMHAANVLALSLLHNPTGTPEALATAAKLIKNRNNPEAAYEILRPGIERGAIGPAKEHELYFGKVPGLAQWSKLMSDITWGVDNAAKSTYAKNLGKGYSAGRRASEDLIDYRYPSEASRNVLSLISRFPTYRSQLLQSVAKGVARNPARAAALMRSTGGLFTGDEVNIGGHKVKSFVSTADVGRAASDPHGFVRSTLGDPQKALLTQLGISHGHNDKYYTYGKNVDAKYLLNALAAGAPEGRSIMDALGLGLFGGKNPAANAVFSLTGTSVK